MKQRTARTVWGYRSLEPARIFLCFDGEFVVHCSNDDTERCPPNFNEGDVTGEFVVTRCYPRSAASYPDDLKYNVGVVPSVLRNMEMNALGVL
jgi:hypothetical protein